MAKIKFTQIRGAAGIICLVFGAIASANVFAENTVVNQAATAGVKRCLPAVKNMADFLIENGNAGSHSVWNSNTPDKQIFTSVIERNFNDGVLLSSLTVSPVPSGACAAVYDQISYSPKSCIAVSKETFGKYEYKDSVNKEVIVLESKEGVNVYLLPAEGGGCVSLKKEVLMDATPK